MKAFRLACGVLLALFVVSCSIQQSWVMIGKWQKVDGKDTIEFMRDGTMNVVSGPTTIKTTFRMNDPKKLEISLGSFGSLPLQMAVALFLAVLLNQKLRGERVFRIAFYLPVILGFNAAVLLCWRLMLNASNGIINQILRTLYVFPPFNYLSRAVIYIVEVVNGFFLGINNGNFTLMNKVIESGVPAANRVPMWVQTPLWS